MQDLDRADAQCLCIAIILNLVTPSHASGGPTLAQRH